MRRRIKSFDIVIGQWPNVGSHASYSNELNVTWGAFQRPRGGWVDFVNLVLRHQRNNICLRRWVPRGYHNDTQSGQFRVFCRAEDVCSHAPILYDTI